MIRRDFIKNITTVLGGLTATAWGRATPAAVTPSTKLLQQSPIAGFQYYQGDYLWKYLRVGKRLTLVREPNNPYDERAVRVEWHGRQIGYLPRMDNAAVSQLLDRGEPLSARIAWMNNHSNPWERMGIDVEWNLSANEKPATPFS